MNLYGTTKLRKLLSLKDANLTASKEDAEAPNAWFANLVWVEGRKCLHITHAQTRYTVLITDIKKAQLKDLKAFCSIHLLQTLFAEGIEGNVLDKLIGQDSLHFGKAQDRRVLGSMNQQGQAAEAYIASAEGLANVDFISLNCWLNRHLLSKAGRYFTPIEELWNELGLAGEPKADARLPY